MLYWFVPGDECCRSKFRGSPCCLLAIEAVFELCWMHLLPASLGYLASAGANVSTLGLGAVRAYEALDL